MMSKPSPRSRSEYFESQQQNVSQQKDVNTNYFLIVMIMINFVNILVLRGNGFWFIYEPLNVINAEKWQLIRLIAIIDL